MNFLPHIDVIQITSIYTSIWIVVRNKPHKSKYKWSKYFENNSVLKYLHDNNKYVARVTLVATVPRISFRRLGSVLEIDNVVTKKNSAMKTYSYRGMEVYLRQTCPRH
jgi:hypothetical protein